MTQSVTTTLCPPYYPPATNTIFYSYLYICRAGRRAHAKLSNSPSFTDKFIDYSSWIINLLLDVLMCSIALYFDSLFVFSTRPTGSSKYGTTCKNIQRYYTPKHNIQNEFLRPPRLGFFDIPI